MRAVPRSGVLSFVHFGDLHITDAQSNNYRDFQALIDEVNTHMRDGAAFAVLPGDNADDGTREQFALVRGAADRLNMPIHILPGDHDFKTKSLGPFYDSLAANHLPFTISLNGYRCLFLDIVSAGGGGPDFRLGADQKAWLEKQLEEAGRTSERSVVFMHAYPADLKQDADEIAALFARHHVVFVDMGHTHYNELANDGRTIYAATRSTGQIEEGPPGLSVVALDNGLVSWRFKPLGTSWPFVLITSPADQHFATEFSSEALRSAALLEIRALAWSGAGIASVACAIDGGAWLPMTRSAESPAWSCSIAMPADHFQICVRAEDVHGAIGTDTISIAPPEQPKTALFKGSDAHSIGAWPERHILGTQLGPNRNGRHW